MEAVRSQSPVKSEETEAWKGRSIYSSETKTLAPFDTSELTVDGKSPLRGKKSSRLTLNFLTPTRILYGGRLALDIEFHMLVRNLLRRISLLAYFHGNNGLPAFDFKGLIEKAKTVQVVTRDLRWYGWERYSGRQERKIDMGGFVGEITFEGDMRPFMALVKAGEVLHVGKGTTFGLGRYRIEQSGVTGRR